MTKFFSILIIAFYSLVSRINPKNTHIITIDLDCKQEIKGILKTVTTSSTTVFRKIVLDFSFLFFISFSYFPSRNLREDVPLTENVKGNTPALASAPSGQKKYKKFTT